VEDLATRRARALGRAFTDNARGVRCGEMRRSVLQAPPPGGFHEGAREIYERLSDFKDTTTPPTVEEAATKLRQPRSL
jgi:hypothetical protein